MSYPLYVPKKEWEADQDQQFAEHMKSFPPLGSKPPEQTNADQVGEDFPISRPPRAMPQPQPDPAGTEELSQFQAGLGGFKPQPQPESETPAAAAPTARAAEELTNFMSRLGRLDQPDDGGAELADHFASFPALGSSQVSPTAQIKAPQLTAPQVAPDEPLQPGMGPSHNPFPGLNWLQDRLSMPDNSWGHDPRNPVAPITRAIDEEVIPAVGRQLTGENIQQPTGLTDLMTGNTPQTLSEQLRRNAGPTEIEQANQQLMGVPGVKGFTEMFIAPTLVFGGLEKGLGGLTKLPGVVKSSEALPKLGEAAKTFTADETGSVGLPGNAKKVELTPEAQTALTKLQQDLASQGLEVKIEHARTADVSRSPEVPPTGKPPRTAGGNPPGAAGEPLPESWLPTVRPTNEILDAAYDPDWIRRFADKVDNPVTRSVAQGLGVPKRDIFTQGTVLRESILADWKSGVVGAMARLRQMGSSEKLFAVDKNGLALVDGRRQALNDVLENPAAHKLTPEQQQYAGLIQKTYADQRLALAAEGIEIKELGFEAGHYVGRRVLGKVGADGNVEIAEIVGSGGKRIGAKAGFEKGRSFDTQAEAIRDGFRYLAPEEALQLNLEAAGRKIADKRLADFILGQIPYRTGAAPEELKIAMDYARDKLATVGKLQAVINRGYRGERVPEATISSIGKHFPDQAKGLVNASISRVENPQARAGLQAVEATIPTIKAEAQAAYYKARSALAEASATAKQPRYGESMVMSPAFQGKFFSAADAEKLSKMLDLGKPSPVRGLAQSISYVNALPRLLLTTFDMGPALIQGQITLFSHPVVWTKAVGRSMQALASEKGYQSFLATHADTIKNWSREGSIFTPSEFTTAAMQQGLATKVPVLRTAVKPFARSFESFLNATRIYGLEATEHLAKTSKDRAGLAKFWNEMTGQVDTARMGISLTQRELETAILFAPRYRRAVYALMTDISKGGLRGQMARDALAKATLAGLAGYVGVAYALGQQPHLDPREGGKFLTVNVAGQNIGMGGTFYATTRMMAQIAMEPGNAHVLAGKYLRNSSSPVVGTAVEAYQFPYGYDSPLKLTKKVLAENLTPIWAQGWLLDNQRGEGAIAATAAEIFGGRTFPDPTPKRGKQVTPIQKYLDSLGGGAKQKQASPVDKYLQKLAK